MVGRIYSNHILFRQFTEVRMLEYLYVHVRYYIIWYEVIWYIYIHNNIWYTIICLTCYYTGKHDIMWYDILLVGYAMISYNIILYLTISYNILWYDIRYVYICTFRFNSAKVAVLVVSPTRELALQIHREVHREELWTDHQPEIFNMRSFTI